MFISTFSSSANSNEIDVIKKTGDSSKYAYVEVDDKYDEYMIKIDFEKPYDSVTILPAKGFESKPFKIKFFFENKKIEFKFGHKNDFFTLNYPHIKSSISNNLFIYIIIKNTTINITFADLHYEQDYR